MIQVHRAEKVADNVGALLGHAEKQKHLTRQLVEETRIR